MGASYGIKRSPDKEWLITQISANKVLQVLSPKMEHVFRDSYLSLITKRTRGPSHVCLRSETDAVYLPLLVRFRTLIMIIRAISLKEETEIRLFSLSGGAPVVIWIVMGRCEAFGWEGRLDSLLSCRKQVQLTSRSLFQRWYSFCNCSVFIGKFRNSIRLSMITEIISKHQCCFYVEYVALVWSFWVT